MMIKLIGHSFLYGFSFCIVLQGCSNPAKEYQSSVEQAARRYDRNLASRPKVRGEQTMRDDLNNYRDHAQAKIKRKK